MATTQVMQRPGGRSARIRQQVHGAVVDLLQEHIGDELTIALISRSGRACTRPRSTAAGAASPALLNDVVAAGPAQSAPLPDSGSLRGDLERYAAMVAESLAGPLGVLMLRAAVSNIRPDADRGPSAALAERLPQLREMLDRARRRGEAAPTEGELLEFVVAPLYFHALFATPASAEDAHRLVDRLLEVTDGRAAVAEPAVDRSTASPR